MSIISTASETSRGRKRALTSGKVVPNPKRLIVSAKEQKEVKEGEDVTLEPELADIENELKTLTTDDISARIAESLDLVGKVVEKTRARATAHSMRVAVRTVQIATAILETRTSSIDTMKRQITSLEERVAMLMAENASLRCQYNNGKGQSKNNVDEVISNRIEDFTNHVQCELLMDQKLAALRAEIRTSKTLHESVGKSLSQGSKEKSTVVTAAEPTEGKKNKKKAKTKNKESVKATSIPLPAVCEQAFLDDSGVKVKSTVVGSKSKDVDKTQKAQPTSSATKLSRDMSKNKPKIGHLPKTAAITISVPIGSNTSLSAAMIAAKQRINLSAEIGLEGIQQRRSVTGGLILEISGPERSEKADALANRLREAFVDMDVRVARPEKSGELRVMDLDDSITSQDVQNAIAEAGACPLEKIKVGQLRSNSLGLGTMWVRCPLSVCHTLAATKRIRVGWVLARMEVLPARQLQCYRCLEKGHVRAKCTARKDRSECCYSCGEPGHIASMCNASALKCPVCADLGRPHDHRLGSKQCSPPKGKRRSAGGVQAPPAPAIVVQLADTEAVSAIAPTTDTMET